MLPVHGADFFISVSPRRERTVPSCPQPLILLQHFAFGAVFADGFLFFLFEVGEGVEDVGELVAGEAVEVGREGVDFGAELGAVAGVTAVFEAVVDAAFRGPRGGIRCSAGSRC